MTLRTKDLFLHKDPNPFAQPAGVSRYAGIPAGIELLSDWYVRKFDFDVIENLPVTTVDWTITEQGTATQALSDDLFPPHLILTNAAADNDSTELQRTAADAAGECIDLTTDRAHYFETMIRFDDANDDDDTVEQVDWFVGWAATDTTVLDGATDFIGFVKQDLGADATGSIDFVSADAGATDGLLVDGSQTATGWAALNPTAVTPDTQAGRRASKILGDNEWIKLGFLVVPSSSGAQGSAYVYVNNACTNVVNLAGQVPDQNLCTTIAFQNGEAVAKIMHVAYILEAIRYDI